MSQPVVYCHNPSCKLYNEPYLQHQEKETGAWVPDWCPKCKEDMHPEEKSFKGWFNDDMNTQRDREGEKPGYHTIGIAFEYYPEAIEPEPVRSGFWKWRKRIRYLLDNLREALAIRIAPWLER